MTLLQMHFACYFNENSKYSSSEMSLVMYFDFFFKLTGLIVNKEFIAGLNVC